MFESVLIWSCAGFLCFLLLLEPSMRRTKPVRYYATAATCGPFCWAIVLWILGQTYMLSSYRSKDFKHKPPKRERGRVNPPPVYPPMSYDQVEEQNTDNFRETVHSLIKITLSIILIWALVFVVLLFVK